MKCQLGHEFNVPLVEVRRPQQPWMQITATPTASVYTMTGEPAPPEFVAVQKCPTCRVILTPG